MVIDEQLQSKLIEFLVSVDDFYVIADELTDVSGNKSCIVKIRALEDLRLVELFLTMVESTGTSEKLAEMLYTAIVEDIMKFTGITKDDALKVWNEKLRGVGSDRAAKMLLWGKTHGRKFDCIPPIQLRQPHHRERV